MSFSSTMCRNSQAFHGNTESSFSREEMKTVMTVRGQINMGFWGQRDALSVMPFSVQAMGWV